MSQQRASLREYQDDILRRMDGARATEASEVKLFFGFVSAGRHYVMRGREVSALMAPSVLEPVPLALPWVRGASNIRGVVTVVTDFAMLVGGEPTKVEKAKFLVLADDVMPGAALLVDGLAGLFEEDQVGPALAVPEGLPNWIVGRHAVAGVSYLLVDGALLASDEKFAKLQNTGD